ncbi:N-formylglutamate amidohydrolase [Hoeflea sp. EC-HK425]|uniref:N-formylglutamate amidohydrolase n=1 Tax=Hoeflea sp. EC-HK425 TaxID=2038388 RepID=UPI0012511305|nr:N-formylglutamate amidohydrolase [Hoeflea sp. EC-HK425]VVT01752.1 Predicted N-formylglutamate amidohydrolase [Hoeflea sp. EC-HK425]|tara:strand:+ start:795 stop:1577 length:783 start_codon:yes stop_codon:yes gene_type:complete
MPGFQPFEILPGDPSHALVILADHAMNRLPAEYGDLGLPAEAFSRHIAYDIGVEDVTRKLSARLGVPAVLGCFSRLLIDPNRGEDDPTLIMKLSDGMVIPANHPLSAGEREHRLNLFHRPYHDAVATVISETWRKSGKAPLVISIHSFTHAWKGVPRPWHAGVLWDTDPRAVRPLIDALSMDPALIVGDNEPYDGALRGDTMHRHCSMTGLPHALLEIRQDLIGHPEGVQSWVDRLAPILTDLTAQPGIHEVELHGSRVV